MSSNFKYTAGLHNVGSYLVSGFPYVTSSTIAADTEVQISFPTVAKSITVIGSSSNDAAMAPPLRIAFNASSAGRVQAGGHYIEVDDDDSFTFNVRCKEIYISCSSGVSNGGYQVFAELTSIPAARIPDGFFTGSGLTD
tara:strand:+ start:1442 stop:1858 length:417 start_codon:yes stop_codon:yes gene_type:complete